MVDYTCELAERWVWYHLNDMMKRRKLFLLDLKISYVYWNINGLLKYTKELIKCKIPNTLDQMWGLKKKI